METIFLFYFILLVFEFFNEKKFIMKNIYITTEIIYIYFIFIFDLWN